MTAELSGEGLTCILTRQLRPPLPGDICREDQTLRLKPALLQALQAVEKGCKQQQRGLRGPISECFHYLVFKANGIKLD